jgi:hypothetical protein
MFANFLITASILSLSLQGWNDLWQGLTVISLAIAFIAGYGANKTGKRLGKVQDHEIRAQKAELVTLSTKLEEQREKTANAERATLELQKGLAPRSLPLLAFRDDNTSTFDLLKPFAGMRVVLRYSTESEPVRAANTITDAMTLAGWKVEAKPYTFPKPPLGVLIEWHMSRARDESPPRLETLEERADEKRSEDAAKALAELLTSFDWAGVMTVREWLTGFPGTENPIPPNAIRVTIGPRDERDFLPQKVRVLENRAKELDKKQSSKQK